MNTALTCAGTLLAAAVLTGCGSAADTPTPDGVATGAASVNEQPVDAAQVEAVKSDVRAAALAIETWLVDNPGATNVETFAGLTGFRATATTHLDYGISSFDQGPGPYCLRGSTGPDGQGATVFYDSHAGGLNQTTPTGGVCAEVVSWVSTTD